MSHKKPILLGFTFVALMLVFLNFEDKELFGNTVRWHESGENFKLHPASFPSGGDYYEAFVSALNEINGETSFLQFWAQSDPCNVKNVLNSENCVVFVNSDEDWLGQTTLRYANVNGRMKSADIKFNASDNDWIASIPESEWADPIYDLYPLKRVALHEVSHSLYLDHEQDEIANMQASNNNMNFERYMADDAEGVHHIYSTPEKTDLSVATVKISNVTGSMSPVARTVHFYTYTGYNGQLVSPVSDFTFEYTIQNMGTTDVNNVDVSFYLTRPWGNEVPLGSGTFDIPAHSSATYSRTIVIPQDFPLGMYRLWFKIDKQGQVTESNENNNALPVPGSYGYYGNPDISPVLNVSTSANDTTPHLGSTVHYQAQICNGSPLETLSDIEVYSSVPQGFLITNMETIIPSLAPNECQTLTTSMVVSNEVTLGLESEICSTVASYYSPYFANYTVNTSCSSVVPILNPDYTSDDTYDPTLSNSAGNVGLVVDVDYTINSGFNNSGVAGINVK